ncbi:MAG: alpha/beta hydrolase, partial [Planctomycetota bacterium]
VRDSRSKGIFLTNSKSSSPYRDGKGAPFPGAIHDCKAAVRYLRANSDELGIDSEQIGAIGLSAGGHLTALLATSGGVVELEGEGGNAEFSSTIQAAVPMGAQAHLMSLRNREVSASQDRGGIWQQFLGGSQTENPAAYKLASPLEHLDAADPPCWFVTGEKDDESTRAKEFRHKAKQLGISGGLTVVDGAPHPFLGKQIWFDQMVERSDRFFREHLMK